MKKRRKGRILALLLAFAMIVGNMTGFGVKAAGIPGISSVTANISEISSAGGTVVVDVKGENLPSTIYYRVRTKGTEITSPMKVLVDPTEIEMVNNQFTITIPPSDLMEVGGKVYVNVNYENSWMNIPSQQTVNLAVIEETGSETTDKSELNAKITEAEKLVETDFTAESWDVLAQALESAKTVSEDADATAAEVTSALNALTAAIGGLQSGGGSGTADPSMIQAKVVDKDGNPVAGIIFDLIDVATNEDFGDITSDKNGKLEYDTSAIGDPGDYLVKIQSVAEYTCQPNDGVTYTIDENKKVVAIDQKPYTGSEDVRFTLTKIGGSTDPEQPDPDANQETLVIYVKDENGKPVTDCDFAMVDTAFPDKEGLAKRSYDGVVKFKLSDLNMKAGEIRVAKTSQYTAVTPKISFTCEKGIFKTVNGNAYDGKTAFDFVVKKNDDPDAPTTIDNMTYAPNSLPSDGGNVNVMVLGKNMMNKVNLEVLRAEMVDQGVSILPGNISNTLGSFTVTFPKNDTKTDRVYTLRVFVKDNPNVFMERTVTVQGVEETGPVDPDPDQPDDKTEGTVTEASVTPNHVGSAGGTVELKVKGTDLTATNWGIDYKCYYENTQIEANKPGTITVKEQTAEGAVLEFSKNPMANNFDYVISVGGKKDGKVQKQAEVKVTQDEKERTLNYKINPSLVILLDSNTVQITMDEDVVFASDDVESLKQYFYIKDGDKRINVTAQDTISIKGNAITVKFKEPIKELSTSAHFYLDEGGLRIPLDKEVTLLPSTDWVIESKPRVTDIVYDKDVYDYKGGKVTARLKGVRLYEVSREQLAAKVTGMGFELEESIPVKIQAGPEPVLTFDVPENPTDSTVSYLLSVYLDGTQVVEGINGNKAERAIVSVLPNGTANDEMTLSHMTITGNNKDLGSVSDTDIMVHVSDSIGELKTELKLSGTNLDSSKTKVRAIDENGIIFPVYDVPE